MRLVTRQAVLRQTDASGKEILANLFVLQAVKAVVVEKGLERSLLVPFGIVAAGSMWSKSV